MKAIQNYSINVVVLENFNDIVPSQQRSKVIEALMIQYIIDQEGSIPLGHVRDDPHDAIQEDV